jgi:superfamily I DNA/RNA helicase
MTTDRWQPIRERAARERALALTQGPAAGQALARAALELTGLEVLPLPAADPMLGGARAMFDGEYVAYDSSLPAPAAAFSLAHELGHRCLHGEAARCSDADINEEFAAERPPVGPGVVEAYSPRARRELEANIFAAAFLIPQDDLAARFRAGARLAALAAAYGVSETAMANALATALFNPPATPPAEPQHATRNTQHATFVKLDPTQEAAATVAAGPVLVDAGPGTGKTRTLIERVLYLLRRGVAARNILALTFSNRAAAEMRERLLLAAPHQAGDVTVGTFHAFCLQLLREHGPDPALLDATEAAALLERHLAALDLQEYFTLANPGYWLKDILGAISRAKDELVGPEGYTVLAAAALEAADPADEKARKQAAKWAEVARVYAMYERLLAERGATDFGGLLLRTVELVRDRPELREHLRQQYREILVDEYQDMNRASSILLQLLAGDGRGLWVVGDLRQAIYRFRGASPANITQFEQDFPGGRRMGLGVNYRSDAQLVGLFRAVGGAMPMQGAPPANWHPARPEAPRPHVWMATAADGHAEARGIAAAIRERHVAGRSYREQVILCRTHRQAEPIARELERQGVPVLYLGPLFERPEVRDLLALLALVAEGGGSLLRVGAMPDHAFPREERIRLVRFAAEEGLAFPAALRHADAAGLSPEGVAACAALAATLDAIGYPQNPWQFLVRYLFGHGALLGRLLADPGPEAAQGRLAIRQFLAVTRDWTERHGAPSGPDAGEQPLRAFLAYVRRLVADKEDIGLLPPDTGDLDAVRVLTVHASKGLEFPVVYLPNLAARRFPAPPQYDPAPPPPGLLADDPGDPLVEETCLFFVALSRARDELILSHAQRYGRRNCEPSPLLDLVRPFFSDITPIYLTWDQAGADAEPEPPPATRRSTARLDFGEIELYLRCPRRYEYNRAIRLREPEEQLGYKQFHDCVQQVLAELRRLRREGDLPATEAGALAVLETAWEEHGPREHTHADLWAAHAARQVRNYWQWLATHDPGLPWRDELVLDIDGVEVSIKVDVAAETPGGALRVTQIKTGRPKDDDGRAPRLSVLRRTLSERVPPDREIRVELHYPMTGETVPVKTARNEADRVRKIEQAVAGIRAGHFPPTPAEDDHCLTCPFWIICPA